MTRVGRACVDRWEAHLVLAERPSERHPHNHRPEAGVRYAARSSAGVYPQAYVNRIEAAAACQAAGKRLCTLGEWYRACRGEKGATWPYGWHERRGACNVRKPHLLGRLFGNDPRRWSYFEHFNAPELNVTPGGLAKTAEHPQCEGASGTLDMVGNVHEWVSDVVDRSLEQKLPLRDDLRGRIDVNTGHGIFMGGFYSTGDEHGNGCAFVTIGHEPKYHDYSTGFRCCSDAPR
jgi:formylglycine-generating enzyme required for sulfatase activity